jgi:hypothetical protein
MQQFNVKYVPPHCRFIREELEKKETKIEEVVASVETMKDRYGEPEGGGVNGSQ